MPRRIGVPADVAAISRTLATALNILCANGKRVGDAKFGAYAFYDYDGEPIYVGQTCEKLRVRIRRHLTNHRTDAVAMNVLDPFEVYEIEMWPLWEFQTITQKHCPEEWKAAMVRLNAAEYSVYQQLLEKSTFNAILNEKNVPPAGRIVLPESTRICIIPEALRDGRKHPDVRIARRASTISSLAKVISERDVSPGLRRTLHTQARRLESLSKRRFDDFSSDPIQTESEE